MDSDSERVEQQQRDLNEWYAAHFNTKCLTAENLEMLEPVATNFPFNEDKCN